MAAMDALSSCSPQANSQPAPPMAQAPKPTGVMNKSELPSCFVFIGADVFVFCNFSCALFIPNCHQPALSIFNAVFLNGKEVRRVESVVGPAKRRVVII